ncbi:hypothetical protein AB0O16_07285 [Microbacterium sp. NPDC089180]|uniref:hypothetical protein n=1 Tax=unclassified Microbacterium TaxID=2609290 RepID=UPI00342BBA6E
MAENAKRLSPKEWFVTYLGDLITWLKGSWVLSIASFVFTVLLVSVQAIPAEHLSGRRRVAITIGLGALIAITVLIDKIADLIEKREKSRNEEDVQSRADRLLRASEEAARNSVSDLNALLETAHELAFLAGASRANQMTAVRKESVRSAAHALGPGARATYYTLEGAPGRRRLDHPVHAVSYGRDDRPDRPFVETDFPELNIWGALTRSDTEAQVFREPEHVPGLDWERKPYATFINIPVKAGPLVFGMLSANSAHPESVGEPQRAVLIGIARALALTESMILGSATASNQRDAMSAASDTLQGIEELERENEQEASK